MMLAGVVLILIKYRVIKVKFILAGKDEYEIAPPLQERLDAKKSNGPEAKETSDTQDPNNS